MRPQPPTNFRRLTRHRCQYCGRDFFTDKRTGRPPLFCDKKCKDGEFRRLRYLTLKNVETTQKTEINSKISKVDFADRSPVEILGHGHRWNGGKWIDRELVAAIIETEIGGAPDQPDSDRPGNPYLAEIPDDLSIPGFLQRRPAVAFKPKDPPDGAA